MPAAVAADHPETTTPCMPITVLGPCALTDVLAACGQAKAVSNRRHSDDVDMSFRIRDKSPLWWPSPLARPVIKAISTLVFEAASAARRERESNRCRLRPVLKFQDSAG